MSVRRHDIEGQAKRLRLFVSEAVRAETGEPLPMTQTLDQMVRAAAKSGIELHLSTESQIHAVQEMHEKLCRFGVENEDLRKALGDLLALYEDDEGCRNLPEYVAGRAAMAKERGQ